jgi:hypothetical protein
MAEISYRVVVRELAAGSEAPVLNDGDTASRRRQLCSLKYRAWGDRRFESSLLREGVRLTGPSMYARHRRTGRRASDDAVLTQASDRSGVETEPVG